MKTQIPPLKCQGIKSKLVPFIQQHLSWSGQGQWLEPFMGSGVVGFNIKPHRAIFADNNPHIINFYQAINQGKLTPTTVRQFLEREGKHLATHGQDYYYEVRTRFNDQPNPLDFLFLNRACFNGIMRFNRQGGFNVPFNHKPERFSKAYITRIVNQVKAVAILCRQYNWQFVCQDFRQTLTMATANDFVYCDPPYAGRHVDYFNRWTAEDEETLFTQLTNCPAHFMLSTWHSNQHRHNPYIDHFWSQFRIIKKPHFYHVGAKERNRKPMLEAVVTNYPTDIKDSASKIA